jgi:zinc D-Ala-D-Ala carboxypeptidase
VRLSSHFELSEFTTSQVAARAGRPIEADADIVRSLSALCVRVLEPLRSQFGRPMLISSGYRPAWLNQAIGGAADSAHLYGRAADFTVPGLTLLQVCAITRSQIPQLPIDQCIYEFASWCHVAIAAEGTTPRGQMLSARVVRGVTEYLPGLVA